MFDDTLLRILEKEVAKEKLKKKARIKGVIKDKKYSKNNNLILIIEKPKYDEAVLVNKNKSFFNLAEKLNLGDEIYVRGDRDVNIVFCDKLELIKKANLTLDKF